MLFYREEKIAMFIDGANLYATARSLGFDIDYRRLLKIFASKARLVRAFYYTALIEDQEFSPIRPLVDWLDYNGYSMVTKPTKEYTDAAGYKKIKGNMDIELSVDIMETADHVDHIILFTGDGDFTRVIQAVQKKGVRTTVVSTIKSQPPMVADELRRQADNFLDLNDLKEHIARQMNNDHDDLTQAERNLQNSKHNYSQSQNGSRQNASASSSDSDEFSSQDDLESEGEIGKSTSEKVRKLVAL